jgi:hypothetical protein
VEGGLAAARVIGILTPGLRESRAFTESPLVVALVRAARAAADVV